MTWHYIAYACAVDPAGPNAGAPSHTQSMPDKPLNLQASGLPSWPPPGLGLTVSTLMERGAAESWAWQGRCFLVWSFDGEMDGETF
jgi:hypothetical protein